MADVVKRPADAVAMVQAQNVHKRFGTLEVLKGIDLTVRRGEVMCLIGASGSGKTTFLRCVNHLEKINGGRLYVDGVLMGYREKGDKLYELHPRDAAKQRQDIGMVFQQFNLFPHMTVLQNIVEAPTRVKGVKGKDAEKAALTLLDRVGLADKARNYPLQLSGGDAAEVDALRRADVGARPRAGRRGARRDEAAGSRRHDDDRGDA
jgi:polar amino acid transport system ATP-binding protein